jgi:hypothetical protein
MFFNPLEVGMKPAPFKHTVYNALVLPRPADGSRANVVIGQVVGIHIADEVISDDIIDVRKLDPLARLGYLDYARLDLDNMFSLRPPGGDHRFEGKSAQPT